MASTKRLLPTGDCWCGAETAIGAFLLPGCDIASFTRGIASLGSRLDNNVRDSRALAAQQDGLLPRLVSGGCGRARALLHRRPFREYRPGVSDGRRKT